MEAFAQVQVANITILEGQIKVTCLRRPFQEKEGWYQFCCINNNETAWIPKILVSLKAYAELTAWEKAQHASIQIDPRDLLRYNEQHIGKLVYYSNVYVFYWLEDGLLVFLDSTEYADPAFLIYPQTPFTHS